MGLFEVTVVLSNQNRFWKQMGGKNPNYYFMGVEVVIFAIICQYMDIFKKFVIDDLIDDVIT